MYVRECSKETAHLNAPSWGKLFFVFVFVVLGRGRERDRQTSKEPRVERKERRLNKARARKVREWERIVKVASDRV